MYSFASTGEFFAEHALQYFKELQADLEPEYWHAHSVYRKVREKRELTALQNYLLRLCEANGYPVIFEPHKVYGYLIPFLADSVPDEKVKNVRPVYYLP